MVFHSQGYVLMALCGLAVVFYAFSLFLSIITLKTEKKAQVRACELLHEDHMATDEEIDTIKKLFKLYNIQYINDIILSALELIYYILQIAVAFSGNNNSSSSNNSKF